MNEAEFAALIRICRSALGRSESAPLDTPPSNSLIDAARQHRLLPHLARCFPQPLRDFSRANTERNLQLVALTTAVVRGLRSAGVDAIALKGPLLARELYGDLSLRICDDVDVLVPRAQVDQACAALMHMGYEAEPAVGKYGVASILRLRHDIGFHAPGDIVVELHADVAQAHYSFPVELASWFLRASEVSVGNDKVPLLSSEDAFVFAVIHGAKHLWTRLDLILDVAALSERVEDWSLVVMQLKRAGAQRAAGVALSFAQRHFGTEPRLQVDSAAERLSGAVESRLRQLREPGFWRTRVLDLTQRERLSDRVRYLGRLAYRRILKLKAAIAS